MSPLDENHQALLIRIYRLAGDDAAAAAAVRRVVGHGRARARYVAGRGGAAGHARATRGGAGRCDAASIQAVTEGGAAAVSAGALVAGVSSFESAVRMADEPASTALRVETRLVLAEALIHSLGGLDEAGLATLAEAERIAVAQGDFEAVARAPGPSWGTSTSSGRATTGPSGCSTGADRDRTSGRRPGRRR